MHALSEPREPLRVIERAAAASPHLREEFGQAYAAWTRTWDDPAVVVSSAPSARTRSPEFRALVAMGPDIVPLLMDKLRDPTQFFALQVVERMVTSSVVFRPQLDDVAVLGGEQLRAHETIKR